MATTVVKNNFVTYTLDDFDETKNYHRILFRPGYSVQARELTQLQTSLQAQIDRYGQFAFKDGSRVVNGKVTLNVEYDFIKISSASFTPTINSYSGAAITSPANNLDEFVGTTITSASGVTAVVQQAIASENADADTLYVKYTNSGTNNTTSTFVGDEEFFSSGSPVRYGKVLPNSDSPTGYGSAVNIEEGVYFIAGTFVYVPAGSLILDKYTNTPNYIVGLKVTESTVDSTTDTSLLDNAQGVPNTAAPGALRYKISTELIKEPLALTSRTENSYITLIVIEDGRAQSDKTDKNTGTELSERLARRTFEESGNYSVNPYQLNVREHLDNEAGNNGYLTSGNGGSATKIAIGVEPNTAYVKGFRVENTTTKYVAIDKPRGTDAKIDINQTQQTLNLGNYIKIAETAAIGSPDITTFETIDLHPTANGGGSSLGTARVRGISQGSSSTELYLYIFDINFTSNSSSMNDVASVVWDDSGTIKFRANLTSDKTIFSSSFNSLVYKLPYRAVDTLRDPGSTPASPSYNTSYVVRQTFTTNATSAADTISGASFINNTNVVAYIKDGSTYGALDASPTAAITGGGSTITFTNINGSSVSLSGSQQIVYTVDVSYTGAQPKTKTKTTQTLSNQSLSSGVLSLDKADIKKITSIKLAGTSTSVLDKFTLDNGQRDNYYDLGKITLKTGQVDPGAIDVVFDWYDHTGTGDFFSVDSYDDTEYETIPSFNGNIGTVQLRDCIDFRPRINDAGTGYASGGNISLSAPPSNSGNFVTDLTHFLPRIDKLYVTRKGEFKVETGVPSSNPKAPAVPDDAMGLYDLRLAPYVFSLNGVKPKLIENKRFTMSDIGSLDKRIKNLEYFTSLSLLEQSAASIQVMDGATERLKNGFIVDNFTNHSIGDPSNPDHQCSVDKANGILRPKFDERNVNLIRMSGDTGNVVINDGIVTLPMNSTDVNYINQPYSSTFSNVNPYNVFSWAGTVKLSPDSDEWKEVDVRPVITVDDSSSYEQFKKMAEQEGILGTVWNEWETNWTGIDVDTKSETTGNPRADREDEREDANNFWWTQGEPEFNEINGGLGEDGTGQSVTTITTTTTTTGQSRKGIKTELAFDTIQKSNGTKIVETNFIPFIRSRKIFFKAELLKPNTKVYAFFDGASIASYIKEESFTDFTTTTGNVTFEGSTSHPDTAGALISNASGVVEGSFIIPRNSALKFATGTREFRLSDSSTNDKSLETTFAEAQYFAQGMLETTEENVVTTKVPRLVQSELNEDRTLVDTQVSETTEYIDPVAETFLVDKEGGIFVKSVDLFFRSKSASVPVRVTIRTTKNGTPTQRIVPGGEKIVYPGSVNLPSDATANNSFGNADVATNFAFDYPVYLSQDTEYAIVITSQSDDYEVYVAEMGGQDLTNTSERITKQPYNGVFFSSANASTWTPEQSKDLKFKLNRATFEQSGAKITFANDIVPPKKLTSNPFYFNGTTTVKVYHRNHGMYSTSNDVTISGATGTNAAAMGTTATPVTHSIAAFTHDTYDIVLGSAASGTGYGGGDDATATENRHLDVIYPFIQNIQVPGTSARFFLKTRGSRSVDGSESAFGLTTAGTDGYEVLPNRNYKFVTPQAIYSAINETNNTGGNKSFQLTAVLTTDNEALSPVIDMNRLSVNTIQNIISNNGGSETTATGGTEVARYITKKIELAEQADVATVYVNVLKPGGSDVDLYWRATAGDEDITAVAWTIQTGTDGSIPFNDTNFKEVRYDIDPFGTGSSFSSIQFKIVMQGSVSSTPPLIKDFRAICAT